MRVLILLRRRNSWNINHKPPLPPALTSIPGQKDEEEEEEEDENIAGERFLANTTWTIIIVARK